VLIEFPHHAGSASAVIGTMRFGVGALAGPVLAWIDTGTPVPVMVLIFGLLGTAAAVQLLRHWCVKEQ